MFRGSYAIFKEQSLLRFSPTQQNLLYGASRDRTDGLLVANQALSQLSYSPACLDMVGLGRFELPTSRLSGVRSNQLSYRPLDHLTNR